MCLGVRAIPYTAGIDGVLTELTPRLVKMGYDVTVYVRSAYTDGKRGSWEYEGVKIKCLPCVKNKFFETISHTFLAVLDSIKHPYDIYYFHAVVTGMFIPVVRLFGKRVVLHTHGLDWKREKWNPFAKIIIQISTSLGLRSAGTVMSVSLEEVEYFEKRFKREVVHLPNGISVVDPVAQTSELEKINVQPGKYVLFLSRLVPEKGCHLLIDAWRSLDADIKKDFNLLIAGDTQYKDKYYYRLKEQASESVIFTGFVTGELKNEILSHAAIFVQPSSMEGMPLSVLEAMSYGLAVVGSDIREIADIVIDKELLFKSGDAESLKAVLEKSIKNIAFHKQLALSKRDDILKKYSWDANAEKLSRIFRQV